MGCKDMVDMYLKTSIQEERFGIGVWLAIVT